MQRHFQLYSPFRTALWAILYLIKAIKWTIGSTRSCFILRKSSRYSQSHLSCRRRLAPTRYKTVGHVATEPIECPKGSGNCRIFRFALLSFPGRVRNTRDISRECYHLSLFTYSMFINSPEMREILWKRSTYEFGHLTGVRRLTENLESFSKMPTSEFENISGIRKLAGHPFHSIFGTSHYKHLLVYSLFPSFAVLRGSTRKKYYWNIHRKNFNPSTSTFFGWKKQCRFWCKFLV